jgi:hypothetical protein
MNGYLPNFCICEGRKESKDKIISWGSKFFGNE